MSKSDSFSRFMWRLYWLLKLNVDEVVTLVIMTGLIFIGSQSYKYAIGNSVMFSFSVGLIFAYIQRISRGTELFRQRTYIKICTKLGFGFGWYLRHILTGLLSALAWFVFGTILSPRASITGYLWALIMLATLAISISPLVAWVKLRMYAWRDVNGARITDRGKGALYMWIEKDQQFKLVLGNWYRTADGKVAYVLSQLDPPLPNKRAPAYMFRFNTYTLIGKFGK